MSSSTVFVVTLIFLLIIEILTPVNSEIHHKFDYGPSERITPYAANDISKINYGSLNRLFKSDRKQDGSNEARNIQNGESSKVYHKNYIDVTYYVGPEAFKASTSNTNSAKYNVKNGSEFIDVPIEEFTAKKLHLNISVDRIINTPRRKCPDGKKLDFFGTCKAVWES
jgi:hypothetical protein